jgi:hypothetical protein
MSQSRNGLGGQGDVMRCDPYVYGATRKALNDL